MTDDINKPSAPSADADAMARAREILGEHAHHWDTRSYGRVYLDELLAAALVEAEARAIERAALAARGGDHSDCGHGEGYRDGRLDAEAAIRALIKTPETAIWRDGYAAADGRAKQDLTDRPAALEAVADAAETALGFLDGNEPDNALYTIGCDVRVALARLDALPVADAEGGWRDIASAPKDTAAPIEGETGGKDAG